MKKFAVKVIAVFAILLMSGQSVIASAKSDAVATIDSHGIQVQGVLTVTAQSQIFYVEAGRFFREYNAQLIKDLTNVDLLLEQTNTTIEMIEIETVKFASAYLPGNNAFGLSVSE